MISKRISIALLAALGVLAGCGDRKETSPASTAAAPAPQAAPAAAPQTATANFMGVTAQVPSAWAPQQPANTMRLAQFSVPPAAGGEPGEVVVFYFGAGAGGSPEENIARWTSQFASADGKPVQPAVRKLDVGPLAVTVVELSGSYSRGVGMGQDSSAKPDQTLLAAIIMTPDKRNVTVHLYGPSATVAAQRASFDAMVQSLKLAG